MNSSTLRCLQDGAAQKQWEQSRLVSGEHATTQYVSQAINLPEGAAAQMIAETVRSLSWIV